MTFILRTLMSVSKATVLPSLRSTQVKTFRHISITINLNINSKRSYYPYPHPFAEQHQAYRDSEVLRSQAAYDRTLQPNFRQLHRELHAPKVADLCLHSPKLHIDAAPSNAFNIDTERKCKECRTDVGAMDDALGGKQYQYSCLHCQEAYCGSEGPLYVDTKQKSEESPTDMGADIATFEVDQKGYSCLHCGGAYCGGESVFRAKNSNQDLQIYRSPPTHPFSPVEVKSLLGSVPFNTSTEPMKEQAKVKVKCNGCKGYCWGSCGRMRESK